MFLSAYAHSQHLVVSKNHTRNARENPWSVNFPVGIHVTVLHYFLTQKNHIVVIIKLFYRATIYWAVTLKSDNKIVALNYVL